MQDLLKSIDEILRLGVFRIPKYQRYYSWDDEQAKNLYDDLLDLPHGKDHFFGTIILESAKSKEKYGIDEKEIFYVVDGQQRLTTSILLLKAFLKIILSHQMGKANANGYKQLSEEYLNKTTTFRFLPHEIDKTVFTKIILQKNNTVNKLKLSEIDLDTPSSNRIFKVYQYFEKALEKLGKKEKELLRNFMKFRNNFKFLKYQVDSEQDAVRIFNTTNDRGVVLSLLDKTKSWAIYYLDRNISNEKIKIEDVIQDINLNYSTIIKTSNSIAQNKYVNDEDDKLKDEFNDDSIQKYHYVFFDKEKGKIEDQLYHGKYYSTLLEYFRELKNQELVNYLEKYFSSLQDAFTSFERFLNDKLFESYLVRIIHFNKLGYVFPLICAVYDNINKNQKKTFLRAIEILMFRVYAVGNLSPRKDLYSFANDFYAGEINFSELIENLKLFIQENQSKTNFTKNISRLSSTYARRYFLLEYENRLKKDNGEPRLNFKDYLSHDVEHIIAESFGRDSDKLKNSETDLKNLDEASEYISRIGNLTLAPQGWNRAWQDATYRQKAFLIDMGNLKQSDICKKFPYCSYETSSLWIQKTLTLKYARKPNKFLKKEIKDRSSDMIEFALKRWSVNSIK